jgi:hypothetical protein
MALCRIDLNKAILLHLPIPSFLAVKLYVHDFHGKGLGATTKKDAAQIWA